MQRYEGCICCYSKRKHQTSCCQSKKVPKKVEALLEEFTDVASADFPKHAATKRDVQRRIDLVLGSQLSNLPAFWMNPNEHAKLKRQVNELLSKGFIRA